PGRNCGTRSAGTSTWTTSPRRTTRARTNKTVEAPAGPPGACREPPMADHPNPNPADDDPEPDPAEADLVAYLDGELDPAATRKTERRRAPAPPPRARADALKRSFALLDSLPKREPSSAFPARTLDKLPAAKSSPAVPPALPQTTPAPVALPG